MNDLVKTDGKTAFTTSLDIAKGIGLEHRAVLQLIRKYRDDFPVDAFEMRQVKFKSRSNIGEYYELDEIQATFLISLMKNSEIVVKFKSSLVTEFFKMRKTISALIAQRSDANWMNVRKDGKAVYLQKTDVIKTFVEYAKAQGSTSAERYYTNIASMENKALFFFDQKYPNMREVMNIKQLMQVAIADDVIEKALKDGMERQLSYKDCYVLAKERVIAYSEIIGKSQILSLDPDIIKLTKGVTLE